MQDALREGYVPRPDIEGISDTQRECQRKEFGNASRGVAALRLALHCGKAVRQALAKTPRGLVGILSLYLRPVRFSCRREASESTEDVRTAAS